MGQQYPATYTDVYGREQVTIELAPDGQDVSLTLRGVRFQASAFDLIYVWPADQKPEDLQRVPLQDVYITVGEGQVAHQALSDYTLHWEMPLQIVRQAQILPGVLQCSLEQSGPTAEHRYGRSQLTLILLVDQQTFEVTNHDPTLGPNLKRLQKQLPEGMYLKCCQFCALSADDLFSSGLLCYRRAKEQIRAVKHLPVYNKIHHPIYALRDEALYVQEMYLCPEFEEDSATIAQARKYG